MSKKVLICPLDWGLGHATRSIPVIRECQRQGAEVLLASSGEALDLLRQEFPECFLYELPSYQPVYPSEGSMMIKMLSQAPRFRRTIRSERKHIEDLVRDHNIDRIISDNRYGCYSTKVRSVLITHQLSPIMPQGYHWLKPVAAYLSKRSIRNFEEVWIPDEPDSGMTTPFVTLNYDHKKFIGWLSRFQPAGRKTLKFDVLAMVSGPEPQRTIFLKMLTDQLLVSGLKVLVTAGEPGSTYQRNEGNLQIVNHLSSEDLEEAMLSSGIIISRSGYSTVMDLMAMGGRAIFIPTPQQTEQVFLASHFKSKGIAFSMDQDVFSLTDALEQSKKYRGFAETPVNGQYLAEAVESLLK